MATQRQLLHHRDQVPDSCPSNARHGCSKAQMCLLKILHVISSYPPCEASTETVVSHGIEEFEGRTGLGVDLNARFGSWPENDQESESTECSFVENKALESDEKVKDCVQVLTGEKSSEYEVEESRIAEERSVKICEIENNESDVKNKNDVEAKDGKELKGRGGGDCDSDGATGDKMTSFQAKERRNRDYLSMLVEAAQLISRHDGEGESDSEKLSQPSTELDETESVSRVGSKRSRYCVVDWDGSGLDDTSPVVRSRRGRSQVLPSRLRDSILEPWKRLPGPQRSAVVSTTKRRSR
ncbi:hypothetical protein HS088_TW22G01202 [Tripterygium wilfordii]|uniref:Uncharacterized protein n=1 Tax=Tripterygium wilfordii TaxID=458696 RepID=A0A7J7C027_TRIWF|nr:hypothetical protein HS088_TW22G01202 [Tripterygium wilfordii]